ncbi:MAG TPA: hypothetical protein VNP90_08280 [Actinomycetota bacterium]|nr:hypothetical protein [Actinomycetota bacterium]
MSRPGPGFDFGADPHCGQGLLRAIVTEFADLLLVCDEDGAVYPHPDVIRSTPPAFPPRPGTWRFATFEEVDAAGWERFLRVELFVDVSGPPSLLPDGEQVSIGASTTRGDVRTDSLVAYLALPRELGGRSIHRLFLARAQPAGTFGDLVDPVAVIGSAFPIDGSEAIDLTGTVRWWGPPSPGPAAIGCL